MVDGRRRYGWWWYLLDTRFGVLAGAIASVALIVQLIETDPLALVFLGLLVIVALFGRPTLLRHIKTETHHR